MSGLSSIAQQLTDQSSTRVVTAVCTISRNRGKERESVGQGCLVQTKQSNECCIVTADKVIPDGQLDTCEVEFTKENSKLKRFSLMDIKKKVKYVSGLVIIVIELNSPKLKHKNNTCSIFTRSPLTITALDERKEQFCYIDRKCYILKVSNDKAIEFRDHAPSTKIPNGLVILQNSTDNSVVAVGIQSQVDGNQKMTIWMNEILAVDDNTDDRHTSLTGNEDSTDSAIRGVGGADQKFQSSKGAYKPERDQDEAVLAHKMFTIGGNEEEVLQAEGNQGFEFHRRPSPTELSYRSFQEPASTIHSSQINNHCFVVNLSPVNGKEKPTMMEVQQDTCNLVSPLAVTDGKGFRGSTLNNVIPQGKLRVELPEGYDGEGRRHSYPYCSLKKEEQYEMKRCFSDMTRKEKKKIKLDDPLAETILNRLDLLEALSRRLDKEYKYGGIQCWKHIAQHFGITEETYQSFKCSKIHSPTEAMLAYLQSFDPNITIGKLKDKLRSVKRQDVVDVLVECEKITDGTMVCSLFESNPDIIGRIAFLLDKEKVGLENWVQLAEKLDIPKNVSKSFETCNTNNPTDGLFEYLKTHYLKMTVEELITHLNDMKRFDVVIAIKKSTQVKSGSLIKDLMEDLLVMDNVCELLNQKLSSKVQGWRHLGARLKIKKDILDDLSPPEEDYERPTEALIRHLGGWKPSLKIADFIRALHEIDRRDTIAVVECYLPDGCLRTSAIVKL